MNSVQWPKREIGREQMKHWAIYEKWVFFCISVATTCALYEDILNSGLVSSCVIKVSCFLLRLLFYYLLHATFFTLSVLLKSSMCGTCMRIYFVLFFLIQPNLIAWFPRMKPREINQHVKNFLALFLEIFYRSHICKQKRKFDSFFIHIEIFPFP